MAANPNHAHTGVARYLLGIGPMPPPRPEDIALAHLQGALDGGAFEQPLRNRHPPLPPARGNINEQVSQPEGEQRQPHRLCWHSSQLLHDSNYPTPATP